MGPFVTPNQLASLCRSINAKLQAEKQRNKETQIAETRNQSAAESHIAKAQKHQAFEVGVSEMSKLRANMGNVECGGQSKEKAVSRCSFLKTEDVEKFVERSSNLPAGRLVDLKECCVCIDIEGLLA